MRLVRYTYPSVTRFAPAFGFQRSSWPGLETEINRLFETTLSQLGATASADRFPVDLYADKKNVYVRAELPGVNRDDINIELADGALTIAATRKTANAATEGQAQPEETASFSRAVNIAEDVQADNVSAAYENGVLTVTLPKREEAKPKKIAVAVK